MGYADLALSQSWREAQNKMNIVLVCSHSVEVDFDITSMYEDMKERQSGCEGEKRRKRKGRETPPLKQNKDGNGNTWRHIPVNLCVCVRFLV